MADVVGSRRSFIQGVAAALAAVAATSIPNIAAAQWRDYYAAWSSDSELMKQEEEAVAFMALSRAFRAKGFSEMTEPKYEVQWDATKHSYIHVFSASMR